MNEHLVSRRRFLKQTSLGAAGLALTGSSWRGLTADDSSTNQSAVFEGSQASGVFEPLRYRPMAARVMGLKKNTVSLNGAWRIDPKPSQGVREQPLNAEELGQFPGAGSMGAAGL